MYIEPNSSVWFCKDIPFKTDYEHTPWFGDADTQTNYFAGKSPAALRIEKMTYVRMERGVLRVQKPIKEMYAVNYMMFKNTSHVNKWFYAFVTRVDYLNEKTTVVHFEIDSLQSWFFEMRLLPCFVEREHSATDALGENLVEDSLETGEFQLSKVTVPHCPFAAGKYDIVIAEGQVKEPNPSGKYDCIVDNGFTGVDFTRFSDPSAAYEKLKEITTNAKADGIVNIFMLPTEMWGGESGDGFTTQPRGEIINHAFDGIYNGEMDGYNPKNNKLFTAPYFGLVCRSSSGDVKKYAIEQFKDPKNPQFAINYSISCSPQAEIVPYNYKGAERNISEKALCTDFPQCAYAIDSFKAYLAQNAGVITAGAVVGVANLAVSGFKTAVTAQLPPSMEHQANEANFAKTLGRTLAGATMALGKARDIYVMPPQVHGCSTTYASFGDNEVGFTFFKYYIKREFAERIDKYYSMFGYPCNTVKKPSLHNRQNWTYVKTLNANVTGNMPISDKEKICSILNNGITFWSRYVDMGNYKDFVNPIL